MTTVVNNSVENLENKNHEFVSGDVVEPGVYVDVETGAMVRVLESDELPDGRAVIHYRRRFQRVDGLAEAA
jgi:hypothetical protein